MNNPDLASESQRHDEANLMLFLFSFFEKQGNVLVVRSMTCVSVTGFGKNIGVKLCVLNNKAAISYSLLVANRADCQDSWCSVHKNINHLFIFLGFGLTHLVL